MIRAGSGRKGLLAAGALLTASACALLAPANVRADTRDPDAERIAAAGHALEWNWTPPGRAGRWGHAETLIHAPLSAVRAQVVDFAHYHDFVPSKFQTSRVVGHGPGGSTDVYVRIAVMHGVVMLWNVTRFGPAQAQAQSPGVETVEGHMVPGQGNIEDLHVVWTMRAIDPQWTVLKADLMLKPGLPAPQAAVDEELRDACLDAVDAVHDRAQGSRGIASWPAR
jgi:hypothetical protein